MNGWFCLRIWRGLILGLFLIVSVFATGAGAASWTHSVTGGYDVWYLDGTTQKFRYNLTNQQWWHFSTVGSTWFTISATGRPITFIGSGSSFDMGNGFRTNIRPGTTRARSGTARKIGSCISTGRASGTIAPIPFHGRRWVRLDSMRPSWGTAIGATLETGSLTSIRLRTIRARLRTI